MAMNDAATQRENKSLDPRHRDEAEETTDPDTKPDEGAEDQE